MRKLTPKNSAKFFATASVGERFKYAFTVMAFDEVRLLANTARFAVRYAGGEYGVVTEKLQPIAL